MRSYAILDGAPTPAPFGAWVDELERGLSSRGAQVRRLQLRDLRISQCRGCFGCWVKTPGRCVMRDDAEEVVRTFVAADVAVIASPVVMGFTTALSRRATERLLPVVHPYLEVVGGEVHHRPRYTRLPTLALVHGHEGVDAEDEALLRELHERMAVNLRIRFALVASTARSPTEVCDALARV